MTRSVLLCTLGASWAVIPEVFGWLAPHSLDLYGHHPQRGRLDAERAGAGLPAPDEIWVCTTEGAQARASVERLLEWRRTLGTAAPALRVWSLAGSDQLADAAECRALRELTLRLALKAREQIGSDGALVLSLAGGRKTMSADLQDAGHAFGAAAWLHVVGPEPLDARLRDASPGTFTQALPAELAALLHPIVVGRSAGDEALRAPLDGRWLRAADHPVPDAGNGAVVSWPGLQTQPTLQHEIESRRRQAQRLLAHFAADLLDEQPQGHWPSLLRLDAELLRALQQQLTDTDASRLERWPLADLHRHVGGSLDLVAQRQVAAAVWAASDAAQRDAAVRAAAPLLAGPRDWPLTWPELIAGPTRPTAAALLLLEADHSAVEQALWRDTAPRVALKSRHPLGFAAYERPGELSGSALLAHPAAVEPYAAALVARAQQEGLRYLELRGSPHKYRPHDPLGFVADFQAALARAGAQVGTFEPRHPGPRIGLLWIVDRRQRAQCAGIIGHAVQAHRRLPEFVLGLDLAGDEGTTAPEALAADFEPAFRDCMRVTIHAGEGESAENIWQAAYHLHADRIGHGLTLAQHPALMQRFRDRGIALELCPTSNREVVGFFDPAVPASAGCPRYPLPALLAAGVPVTLNTDNPGISRTAVAAEFIAASRMAGGVSAWRALALLRNAYDHAFVPAAERALLVRTAERQLLDLFTTEACA